MLYIWGCGNFSKILLTSYMNKFLILESVKPGLYNNRKNHLLRLLL